VMSTSEPEWPFVTNPKYIASILIS
jgi:hypothetical protein